MGPGSGEDASAVREEVCNFLNSSASLFKINVSNQKAAPAISGAQLDELISWLTNGEVDAFQRACDLYGRSGGALSGKLPINAHREVATLSKEFHVGEWRVQPQLNLLSRGKDSVTLEPKVIDLLVYLIEHAGEVLAKERLIDAIWSDAFVGDEVLTYSISALRKALGDNARDPTYIQTIPKRGYRLIARVSRKDAAASGPARTTGDIGPLKFAVVRIDAADPNWREVPSRSPATLFGNAYEQLFILDNLVVAHDRDLTLDITLQNSTEPGVLSGIGVEVLHVGQNFSLFDQSFGTTDHFRFRHATATKIVNSDSYLLKMPNLLRELCPLSVPTRLDYIEPRALRREVLLPLPDPIYLESNAPYRFSLRLHCYHGRVPQNALIQLIARSDQGISKSHVIRLADEVAHWHIDRDPEHKVRRWPFRRFLPPAVVATLRKVFHRPSRQDGVLGLSTCRPPQGQGHPSIPIPLPLLVASDFRRYLSNELPLSIATANADELERRFDESLHHSTRVFDVSAMDFELLGGRIHRLGGRRTALFVYRDGSGSVYLFETSPGSLQELPARGLQRQLENDGTTFLVYWLSGLVGPMGNKLTSDLTVVFWQEDDTVYVVTSNAPQDQVLALACAGATEAKRTV